MGIAGLGTYSSTSFYYKMTSQGNNTNVNDKFDLGLVPGQNNNQDETADTVGKPARTSVTVPYTRCITTTIQTEEMYASQSENGEMVYSYKASEQSFNIYINSDGQNKTYSIEGIDKDGQPFTKEFDPYDVDPEYADFPEFAALCLYIQNTDETADMLANDYFATDDILEKCDYLEKLQGFGTDTIFEKAQSMLDLANKLVNTLQQITDTLSQNKPVTDPNPVPAEDPGVTMNPNDIADDSAPEDPNASVVESAIGLIKGTPNSLFDSILKNKSRIVIKESGAGVNLSDNSESIMKETICTYAIYECIHSLGMHTYTDKEKRDLITEFALGA